MLCNELKSRPIDDLLALTDILERIECETPQIVYILQCRTCHSTHSIEFAIDAEHELLASRYRVSLEPDKEDGEKP